jgi:hypothetical protein
VSSSSARHARTAAMRGSASRRRLSARRWLLRSRRPPPPGLCLTGTHGASMRLADHMLTALLAVAALPGTPLAGQRAAAGRLALDPVGGVELFNVRAQPVSYLGRRRAGGGTLNGSVPRWRCCRGPNSAGRSRRTCAVADRARRLNGAASQTPDS